MEKETAELYSARSPPPQPPSSRLPQLNSCCCGCSLRTGTLILGWLGVVGSLVGLVVSPINAVANSGREHASLRSQLMGAGRSEADIRAELRKWDDSHMRRSLLVYYAASTIIVAVNVAMNVMLLFGVYQERPRLVRPWLLYSFTAMLLHGILNAVLCGVLAVEGQLLVAGGCLLGLLLGAALSMYLLLVVYSYYRQLRDNPQLAAPELQCKA